MTTFLVGAGLIAVPIIIHIFNRTRYKRIEWAAMEFLLNAYRKTRRRLRFENLLLLLLRVFAMLFIAFAFFPDGVSNAAKWLLDEAGISFTGGAGATKPQHLVLVLDDTASMRYRELQLTNFDNGIKTANDLLSRLNDRRDRVTLIRVSTVQVAAGDEKKADDETLQRLNRDVPVIDVKKARELLGHALPGYGTGSLLPALREAGRRIASMDDEKEVPRLSIISDMQANAWAFGNPGSAEHQTFVNIMEEIGAKLQKHNIPVMWHVVGQNSTRNRGITGLSLEDPVVGVGIPNSLNVQVGNFGSGGAESSEFKLTYRIDNEEERPFSQSVSVEPGMVRTIRQDIPAFQTAGCHSIQIKITDQDRLEDDNTRTIAFDVVEAVEILIVNGAPDEDFSKDEVAMFKLLLDISSWYNPEEGRKKTINRVSVVTERQLSTTDLSVYDVIAICNVGSVTEEFAKSLYDYLDNRGGSLVFTLGANVNADDYNTHFWREGKGLMPARLDTPEGDDADVGNPKLHTIKGVDLTPGTPFAMFDENDLQRGLLENPTAMRRWYGVSTP
ncbi:MAG: BatA domain-containing protein, partial [Planctomycetes bacterium]|nr:BatA domain-containing protein [Planctomycetota bacterium]